MNVRKIHSVKFSDFIYIETTPAQCDVTVSFNNGSRDILRLTAEQIKKKYTSYLQPSDKIRLDTQLNQEKRNSGPGWFSFLSRVGFSVHSEQRAPLPPTERTPLFKGSHGK